MSVHFSTFYLSEFSIWLDLLGIDFSPEFPDTN